MEQVQSAERAEAAVATLNGAPAAGPDSPPPAAASPTSVDEAGGSLDKVRDILFGVQLRDVDRRFARLEQRMVDDAAALREDLRRRLAALEQYVKSEVESLNTRLRAEHEMRSGTAESLARDLASLTTNIDRRTAAIDDAIDRKQREVRQQLLEQHQQLSDDLLRKSGELLAALTREADALRHAKTDRASLAALLNEMATRLADDADTRTARRAE